MKKIIVLGASGTIGQNTIDIIRRFSDRFELAGVSVHTKSGVLDALRAEFHFQNFAVTDSAAAAHYDIKHRSLERFLTETPADIVVNGIAGAAGLQASLVAVRTHRTLALANKESIVMAGDFLQKEAEKYRSVIIPVDSEHSAIYSLIRAYGRDAVERLIITASGGPFRTWTRERIQGATLQDALKHPTWTMGAKITIDSASLANKALEVIEAVQLFDVPTDRITVAVHPSSIVHSMVQLKGGEVYAQLSPPDMRNPIFTALSYPEEPPPYLAPLDFSKPLDLHFEPPRLEDFPMLSLGFTAARKKAGYPIAFNAANEQAVAAFLRGKIRFVHLAEITGMVMQEDWSSVPKDVADVMQIDKAARRRADVIIEHLM
ncbi:1-deoxy-D-xylulose 5-phosphate reductoisomerase [Treponema vincentii F0403]|uniref:1-deoxy-D-xylulose 5-phosphate reductoisomerase n=1 Tax=Treponema vincentii F0403 TaxID=1125702 RepID=S3LBB8_9SPIR|nr:1-deoxy-D-xylulose-5-phosphate reductoisomerase [Treponema vincentii]EPF47728.1 1-deoxy-D-xylulose 5-phosphate reductoisomerase [Treponema vincentii F0403]